MSEEQKQALAESFWQFIEDGDLNAHLRRAAHIEHGCPKKAPLGAPGHTMCWTRVG